MLVILKCHPVPSVTFRLMTRPLVVCTFAFVMAGVTDGVSATAFTAIVAVTISHPTWQSSC